MDTLRNSSPKKGSETRVLAFWDAFYSCRRPLATQIRTSKSIKGLKNRNKESKVSLYANDTTTFIHDDSSAVAPFRFA